MPARQPGAGGSRSFNGAPVEFDAPPDDGHVDRAPDHRLHGPPDDQCRAARAEHGGACADHLDDAPSVHELHDIAGVNPLDDATSVLELHDIAGVDDLNDATSVLELHDIAGVNPLDDAPSVHELHDIAGVNPLDDATSVHVVDYAAIGIAQLDVVRAPAGHDELRYVDGTTAHIDSGIAASHHDDALIYLVDVDVLHRAPADELDHVDGTPAHDDDDGTAAGHHYLHNTPVDLAGPLSSDAKRFPWLSRRKEATGEGNPYPHSFKGVMELSCWMLQRAYERCN